MMRRAPVLVLAVLSAGFNVVRDVDGDGPIVFANPMVTLELQQDGSADVSDGSDLQALRDAMDEWNQVGCSAFRFIDGGTGTSRNIGADGVNRITFLESNWPGYASGAAAFTLRERVSGTPDRWTEFDIEINGQDLSWATDGETQRPDIRSVVVHELGHGLGLQHASEPQASMFFTVRFGTTFARTLHADDIAGACYLYPAQTFSCSTDADCPVVHGLYGGGNYRARCNAGTCTEGPAASFGAGCFEADDCGSGLCLIDPLEPPTTEPGFCSEPCPGGTCPSGDYCAATPNGPRCIVGRDDCAVDADCGGNPVVCARQLDGRFACQRLCLRNSACASIPGAVCHGGTGENPAGFCRVPGTAQPGEACENGLECASLNCSAGGVQPTCRDGIPGFDEPPPMDAGRPDLPTPADAGGPDVGPRDLGTPDASPRPDAGRPDNGTPVSDDGGSINPNADAGGFGDDDAGSKPADLVGTTCHCLSRGSKPSALLYLGFALLFLMARQRRPVVGVQRPPFR